MNARIGCPARSLAWDLGGAARGPELRGTTSWPTCLRVGEEKIRVKVIRHTKMESLPQAVQQAGRGSLLSRDSDQETTVYAEGLLMPSPKAVVVTRLDVPSESVLCRGWPIHEVRHDFAPD
jgi:hypothetical protein